MSFDAIYKAGVSSKLLEFGMRSSSTGQLLTGLAAASVTCTFQLEGAAGQTTVTLDGTMVLGTWKTGGWKETGTLGLYQFGAPNASLTGAQAVTFVFKASGAIDTKLRVVLVAYDPQDTAIGLASVALPAAPVAGTWGESLFFALNRLGRRNTAQGGTTNTITLDAGASAVDNIYATHSVRITSGTGSGQIATITGYVGLTKVATVTRPGGGTWTTTPDNTSVFQIEAVPSANMGFILFSALTESVGGYLAAGLKKLLNVVTPLFTVASVNQTGDAYAQVGVAGAGLTALGDTRIANLDMAISAVNTAVGNLNNLSALANLFSPATLVRPASGSIVYPFTFVVKDTEGHLVDVDSNTVTLTATNAAGTDRSANLSAVTHAGTGEYTFTYTVSSAHADEGLRFTAAGTVQSASRKAYSNGEVQDADNLSALAAIQAVTDQVRFTIANQVDSNVVTKTGFALSSGEHTNIATDVQTGLTAQGLTTARAGYLDVLNGLLAAIWANATRTLTAISDSSGVTTLLTRITGLLPVAADYSSARAAKLDNLDATMSSRTKPADTQARVTLVDTATALTNAPTVGDFTAAMKTSLNAATPSVSLSSAERNAAADAFLIRAMTEDYSAKGSTMSLAQFAYLLAQRDGEFSISGQTISLKKLDGATVAATYTINSSTDPTSITRAT